MFSKGNSTGTSSPKHSIGTYSFIGETLLVSNKYFFNDSDVIYSRSISITQPSNQLRIEVQFPLQGDYENKRLSITLNDSITKSITSNSAYLVFTFDTLIPLRTLSISDSNVALNYRIAFRNTTVPYNSFIVSFDRTPQVYSYSNYMWYSTLKYSMRLDSLSLIDKHDAIYKDMKTLILQDNIKRFESFDKYWLTESERYWIRGIKEGR